MSIIIIALGVATGLMIFTLAVVTISGIVAGSITLYDHLRRRRNLRRIRKGMSQIGVRSVPSDERIRDIISPEFDR